MKNSNSEENRLKALNEKYLKKFIRKFWLQPIAEQSDEKDISLDFEAENCEKNSDENQNFKSDSYGQTIEEIKRSSSESDMLFSHSELSGPDREKSSSNCEMSSSDKTTSRGFQKTHRRQKSYGNVDLIFLEKERKNEFS